MHPIERLRYVARADGAGPALLAQESAAALAGFTGDGAGLVTGCRRLVERHLTAGPVWWLAARLLASADPAREAAAAARELDEDPTPRHLADELPSDVTVTILGWPEHIPQALRRRGDLEVLVVDAAGEGSALVRRLVATDVDAVDVRESGLGAAVADSKLVLLEASALGPTGLVAPAGSRAAAAVARHCGVPVWAVAGAGTVLPGRLWDALCARLEDEGDPWDLPEEVVPLDLVDEVVGPAGREPAADAPKRADCPVVPELLKPAG